MATKKVLPLSQYIQSELEQIRSPLNVWGTGKVLKREPNPTRLADRNALVRHWIKSRGVKRFAEQHEIAQSLCCA
jgi:hypothetical protein